jgi:hypothetical protein
MEAGDAELVSEFENAAGAREEARGTLGVPELQEIGYPEDPRSSTSYPSGWQSHMRDMPRDEDALRLAAGGQHTGGDQTNGKSGSSAQR